MLVSFRSPEVVKAPTDNAFYIIGLTGKRSTSIRHNAAQAELSRNEGNLFWMNFFPKTDIVGEFYCHSNGGLVSSNEIIQRLTNPSNVLTSSSRKGKLIFKTDEILPFISTLQ